MDGGDLEAAHVELLARGERVALEVQLLHAPAQRQVLVPIPASFTSGAESNVSARK